MDADLVPDEFADFFQALYNYRPFPWQQRLADQVFTAGWPFALDIPTGAGKTAAIDIAIFHLALEAARGPQRRAAARILFVVDRRLVVDDAHRRAERIAAKLAEAPQGVLERVAQRLRLLAEDGRPPLAVARLRGGIPKEPDWVRTPAQPTVVISTVDQVGSRLLFRGYGVSDTMKPIHAGLLGCDALLLLDEAHLSQPFVRTARDSLRFGPAPWNAEQSTQSLRIVTLSATQRQDEQREEQSFKISATDRADPRLSPRLGKSKPAELISVESERDLTTEMVSKTKEFISLTGPSATVAIVVNRVGRARAIFEALKKEGYLPLDESSQAVGSNAECALLIGRTRDIDREARLKTLLPFVRADDERDPRTTPLVVVATQCIEAGADLDFDALITEIAPLDCLRQRFGRLARTGRATDGPAAIIAMSSQVKKSAQDDPIYGTSPRSTWNLLWDRGSIVGNKKDSKRFVDFGIEASGAWMPKEAALAECLAPSKEAPVLMPSAIEFWSRTSPIPYADAEISLYLHGPQSGVGDIDIVWRGDFSDDEAVVEAAWKELSAACPPSALEAISVPLVEAKSWLKGKAQANISDTEGAPEPPEAQSESSRLALCWRGAENDQTRLVRPNDLRPGDLIVVPSSRGGCDGWGWNPRNPTLEQYPVVDVAREANRRQRGRDILRLSAGAGDVGQEECVAAASMQNWPDKDIASAFASHFEESEGANWSAPRVIRAEDGRPIAIERRLRQPRTQSVSIGDAVTEDDESVRALERRQIRLCDHSKGVEGRARRFAEQAGLEPELIEDIALAGYLHDAGKAQPDFKRFLYAGDELAAIAGPDLAKSAKLPAGPRAWADVRRLAGLPKGARHEVASLSFALAHPRFGTAHCPDLVLWLIGTHHGYGRPFFPAPEKEWPSETTTFRTDLGDGEVTSKPASSLPALTAWWFDLYQRVTRHHGIWNLARLEAVLRLADHRRSEAEQHEG